MERDIDDASAVGNLKEDHVVESSAESAESPPAKASATPEKT
jgi:hypothetical protein